jgi:hypothetical protein
MVPLSHQKKLVAQLVIFFEPFEPPINVDGSTLGVFWDFFLDFRIITLRKKCWSK